MAALEVAGLGKTYGDVVASDGVSFSVAEGEVFGLLGPEGAGKTTLVRTVLGLQYPTWGTATVLGADVRDRAALREALGDVGYLPEDPTYEEYATGREYLEYRAGLAGDERLERLLVRFDVPVDEPIHTYTESERTLLGIVQAFAHDPDLAILDEPMVGVEPVVRDSIEEFLRLEADDGTTIVVASASLGQVRRLCDRIAILRNGHLEAVESTAEFREEGAKRVRIKTVEDVEATDLNKLGVVDLVVTDRGAQFTFLGDYALLADHLRDFELLDVTVEEGPIDDVLEHYYGPAGSPSPPERSPVEEHLAEIEGLEMVRDGLRTLVPRGLHWLEAVLPGMDERTSSGDGTREGTPEGSGDGPDAPPDGPEDGGNRAGDDDGVPEPDPSTASTTGGRDPEGREPDREGPDSEAADREAADHEATDRETTEREGGTSSSGAHDHAPRESDEVFVRPERTSGASDDDGRTDG